eukprot:1142607-Pyramimonas_sp.AAC.1
MSHFVFSDCASNVASVGLWRTRVGRVSLLGHLSGSSWPSMGGSQWCTTAVALEPRIRSPLALCPTFWSWGHWRDGVLGATLMSTSRARSGSATTRVGSSSTGARPSLAPAPLAFATAPPVPWGARRRQPPGGR